MVGLKVTDYVQKQEHHAHHVSCTDVYADFSDTRKLLLDSASVLRGAAVRHLLAFEIVRRLYTSVARQHVLPCADPVLVFLLQLLQLGADAPAIVCGHADAPRGLPEAPAQALHVLLPILAGIIIDSRCAKVLS
jgi:hypothetical protein